MKCLVKISAYPFSNSKTLSLQAETVAFQEYAITMRTVIL